LTAPATRGRPPPASPVTTPTVGAREGDRKSVGLGEDEVVRERCAVRETLALRLALRLDEPARVLETVTEALTLGERERVRVAEAVPLTDRETLAVCDGLREELAERLALRETVAVAVTAADCVRDGETVLLALLLKDLLSESLRDMDLVSEAVMLNERLTEAVSEGDLLSLLVTLLLGVDVTERPPVGDTDGEALREAERDLLLALETVREAVSERLTGDWVTLDVMELLAGRLALTLREPVRLREAAWLAETEREMDAEAVALRDAATLAVRDWLTLAEMERETLALALPLTVRVTELVIDAVVTAVRDSEADCEPERLFERVAVRLVLTEEEAVLLREMEGEALTLRVTLAEAEVLGEREPPVMAMARSRLLLNSVT